jgi:hypothetical protein
MITLGFAVPVVSKVSIVPAVKPGADSCIPALVETVSLCKKPELSSRAEREILRFQLHMERKISRLRLEMTLARQSRHGGEWVGVHTVYIVHGRV